MLRSSLICTLLVGLLFGCGFKDYQPDCSHWGSRAGSLCPKLNRLPNKYYANSITDDNAESWLGHHIEEVIKSWGQPSSVRIINGVKTYNWSKGGGWVGTDVKFDRHTRTHYYNKYESDPGCVILLKVDDNGKVVRVIGDLDDACLNISNWYPYPSPEYAAEKTQYLKTHNSPEVLRVYYPNGL